MTGTIHKLTAGNGYEYLTKSVAAMDATDKGRVSLADYYSAKGDSPGVWMGSGLTGLADLGAGMELPESVAALRSIADGSMVTAEQMKALFGEGRHPNATAIERALLTAGIAASKTTENNRTTATKPRASEAVNSALAATKLGHEYAVYDEYPPFLQALAERFRDHNLASGRPWNDVIDDETRATIRTQLAREWFDADYHRPARDERELSGYIAQQTRQRQSAVAGYDMTFSPVKSVSTLWAIAPIDMASTIEDAHRAAVSDAIAFIEREACYSRLGTNGVAQVDTDGLIAAAFTHRDSRAGDPDLHTHVAISNKVRVRDAAGIARWMALDGRPLYKATVSASEVYNSRLELYLHQSLGVTFSERAQPDLRKRAVREIDGIPTDLMQRWSSRREAIEARVAELSTQFHTDHGREPTTGEAFDLAQQATLDTREKKHEPRSYAEQRRTWRAEAEQVLGGESGLKGVIADAAVGRPVRPPRGTELDLDTCQEVASDIITVVSATRARWQRPHLRAEAERQLRDRDFAGLDDPATISAAVEQIVDTALSSSDSVRVAGDDLDGALNEPHVLRRANGESVFTRHDTDLHTSRTILAAEARIVAAARRVDGRTIDGDAVSLALLEQAANGHELNDGQSAMVREMATSGRRVQLVLAPAGTGKTTALRTLARAWNDSGGTTVGLAPTAAAAAVLREELDTTTDTAAKLVQLVATERLQALAATPRWRTATNPRLARQVRAARAELSRSRPPTIPDWFTAIGPNTLVVVDEAGMASTADLDTVIRFVCARGGSVRLVGDDQQLASISAGGVLRDIAHETGALTLSQVVRFADPAEGAASLALRDGDPAALGFYADAGRVHVAADTVAVEQAYTAWAHDRDTGRDTVMLAATRDTVNALNERARADRLAADPAAPHAAVQLSDGLQASIGDLICTRSNRRDLRLSATDWVRNGDRWQVTALGADGALTAQHLDTGRLITLPADYVADNTTLGYASTIHAAQGMTADTCHVVGSDALTRQLLYVAMTRGRHANHIYLATAETDPHNATTPKARHPNTGLETLAAILERDGAQQSATTAAREATDPATRLHLAAGAYAHAVGAAAEDALGAEALQALERDADNLYSTRTGRPIGTLTDAPAWPVLRHHLATLQLRGADPLHRLATAIDMRELDTADDPAAVLDWRIDDTQNHSAGTGPLPWLPQAPAGLDDTWRTYLTARADRTSDLATEVAAQAATWTPETAPRWARPLLLADPDRGQQLVTDLAVWRASHAVADTDRRPAGPTPPAARLARHHRTLTDRATALIQATADIHRWSELAASIDNHLLADPYWPELAEHLAQAHRAGLDVDTLVRDAATAEPLPTEMPAAALWWRLSATLTPAAAETSESQLRPAWAHHLTGIVGDRAAHAILTDPAWPALVAAVHAADPDQWEPADLLHLANDLLHGGADTTADATHTVRLDEYARLLTWRIELILTHSTHAADTTPPPEPPTDPAAEEAAAAAAGRDDPWSTRVPADTTTTTPPPDPPGTDVDYLTSLTTLEPPPETDLEPSSEEPGWEDLDWDDLAHTAATTADRAAPPDDIAECIALSYELRAQITEARADYQRLRAAVLDGRGPHTEATARVLIMLRESSDTQRPAAIAVLDARQALADATDTLDDLTTQADHSAATLTELRARIAAGDISDDPARRLDPDYLSPDDQLLAQQAEHQLLTLRVDAATTARDAAATTLADAETALDAAVAAAGGRRVTPADVDAARRAATDLDTDLLADHRRHLTDLDNRLWRTEQRLARTHALTHTAHHHRDDDLTPRTSTSSTPPDPDRSTEYAAGVDETTAPTTLTTEDTTLEQWLRDDPVRLLPDHRLARRMTDLDRRHRIALADLATGAPRSDRAEHIHTRHTEHLAAVAAINEVADLDAALAAVDHELTALRTDMAALAPPRRGRAAREAHQLQHDRLTAAQHAAAERRATLQHQRTTTAQAIGIPESQWAHTLSTLPDADTRNAEIAAAHAADQRARELYQHAIDERDYTAHALQRGHTELARRAHLTPEQQTAETRIRDRLDNTTNAGEAEPPARSATPNRDQPHPLPPTHEPTIDHGIGD